MTPRIPDPVLTELDDAWGDFIVGLRMNGGLDAAAHERLRRALQACAKEWEGRDAIPRLGANILVDVFLATEGAAGLYQGDLQRRILEAAAHLQELVHQCVGIRGLS